MPPQSSIAPVVLLVYNRPALTRRMFEQVRLARPSTLLVVADGPRPDRPSDLEACAQVRAIIESGVDWGAKVLTNYAPANMGLRRRVSSGLSWAFQQVEEAIILEDDCVPHPSFFRFSSELLRHYAQDTRIGVVTGNNFQPPDFACAHSYYFSKFAHCWGWATWRRAWDFYDDEMKAWPALKQSGWLRSVFPDPGAAQYWAEAFDRVYERKLDSWATCWVFCTWSQSLLTAIPKVNLVANIGFGPDSTHTSDPNSPIANLPARELDFPLSHPACAVVDSAADDYSQRKLFGSGNVPPKRGRGLLSRILGRA